MKAVVFHELGGADVLGVEEWEKQTPGPGEVLIRVTSAGLNRADILFQIGRYYQKPAFPSRTGKEAAGYVEAVGEGVRYEVGDRVGILASTLNASTQGGMAEYVVAPERFVVRTPESVSDEDAGGIWMQYLTAYGALNGVVNVKSGQHVVITASSSSVGVAAIQLVNRAGGISIATTTSPEKVERLKELGAAHVVNTQNEKYVERVAEITRGNGADVIFDAVTGTMMAEHIEVVKRFGWIFFYGVLDVSPMSVDAGLLIGKNATLRAYSAANLYKDSDAVRAAVDDITQALDSDELSLVIDSRFPMADVQDAILHMQSNQQIGKIVVNP